MSYFLGIDLGTSSLKTMLIDECGDECETASESLQISSPHQGWSEQDPEQWWNACVRTIRKVLSKTGVSPDEIKALSFSGQMHGLVMLDREGKLIRPAILHNDARSGGEVRKMQRELGKERIQEWMMNPVYSGFLLVSLLWVRDHEPENFSRLDKVMLPKDYLKFKLCGEVTSDYSDASATLAYDIKGWEWSRTVLDYFGLRESIFPPCYGTHEAIGHVSRQAADETGVSSKTLVVSGGGDQIMQGIGNGVIHPGDSSVNIGTAGQVSFRSDRPILNPELSTNTFCGYQKGSWITMGAIMNAGVCLKWWDHLFGNVNYRELDEMVTGIAPGSRGIIFLPYLNGERTPHMNPDISGGFVGLNLSTGRAEMTRSVMEGVTYALYQCTEICRTLGLPVSGAIVASGGGARSIPWRHIIADVFGTAVKVSTTEEQACLGAAIAAGTGAGVYKSIDEGVGQLVHYQDDLIVPNMDNHKIYQEYYRLFKDFYKESKKQINQLTLLGRS